MVAISKSKSAQIRSRLKHPVIDSDGHLVELNPVLEDYVREVGGGDIVKPFASGDGRARWATMTEAQRLETGTHINPWWVPITRNTLDRATASLPRLLNERMDEIGLDYAVLYPTTGLSIPSTRDDELRRVGCRAMNRYLADLYGQYPDRMTPAAVIPMHTPEEGIQELEYAVNQLGFKAIMIAGYVSRPIAQFQGEGPGAEQHARYIDTYGLDSPYDYDPFWAKCIELGVPPATHSVGMGVGFRRSLSVYMYNHVGHFAAVGEALAKSLFFGGVTRRFPTLRVALLECGAGWAADVYAGIVARWKKRNRDAIRNMDPGLLDKKRFMELVAQYGDGRVASMHEEILGSLDRPSGASPANLDDWHRCAIEKAEDIKDLFIPNFYFGCEADDPMNVWAFNDKVNPFGARLGAVLSSDIGHWDVPDMREVLEEAYEMVEDELINERDFKDFVFGNPVGLYTGMNPNFFKGTRVEADVDDYLKRGDKTA